MKKQLPILMTDEEAEDFVANSDLTEYDLSKLIYVKFELKSKDEPVDRSGGQTCPSENGTKA